MNSKKPLSLELEKRLKPCPVDFKRVEYFVKRARKDLASAELLSTTDLEAAYTLLYDGMLHAGLAFMAVSGIYPDVKGKHKTVVEYVAHKLGKGYESQMKFYDRMRRKRHQFIYEPGPIGCTQKEMEEARQAAQEFLKVISERIKEKSPQKELEL